MDDIGDFNTGLQALITYDDTHEFMLPIPYGEKAREHLSDFLCSAGWWNPTGELFINGDPRQNTVTVHLTGDSPFAAKTIPLFNKLDTLNELNEVCRSLCALPAEQRDSVIGSPALLSQYIQHMTSKTDQPLSPAEKALDEPDAGEDARTAALRERLMERIDDNFQSYIDYLRDLKDTEIIDSPLEISARTGAYFYLTTIHNFHASELEYLLQFENPLRVAADEFEWESAAENRSDIMWNIFHKQDALKNGKHALSPDTESLKGYIISYTDDDRSFYIPNITHIERDDSLNIYPDDDTATRAAEKDGVKLIYGLPNVPDGVYLDTRENRDAIAAHFERHRLSLPADDTLTQALYTRLDDNFNEFKERTLLLSKTEIFDEVDDISAVCRAYEFFKDEHAYTTGQAEFLLKFKDPLDFVSDCMISVPAAEPREIMGIFHKRERMYAGLYDLVSENTPPAPVAGKTAVTDEKLSVMDQIRQAAREARERPMPPKEAPGLKKSGPEL